MNEETSKDPGSSRQDAATPGQVARDEQLAIAAFGAWIGQTDAERVLLSWSQQDESNRAAFRAVADAVRMRLNMPRTEPQPAPELAAVIAQRDRLAELVNTLGRLTTAWTRGMYSARIDCVRGDIKAAISCLSEGLDGYDGTEWNGTETGAEWWERTKAEECQ